MFIDTHSRDSMVKSVCEALKISKFELRDKLYTMDKTAKDDDEYYEMIDAFVDERLLFPPDEILLFHFARRLHGTEGDVEGRNLADLLTTENAFSEIMKKEGLQFVKGAQHIDVLYKGKIVDWDKCYNGNSSYMKLRLGYYKGREDYCFTGFAFKDLLYKNHYARALFWLPEFIGQLIDCLGCKSIGIHYMENGTYYCYEYKIPLEYVMFDDHDTYWYEQKQKYLIRCTLLRIAQYQTSDERYMFDHDNPVLRLGDNFTLPAEYFVSREEVTSEMLR